MTRPRARRALYSAADVPRAVLDRLGIDRKALPAAQLDIVHQHVSAKALRLAMGTQDMAERTRVLLAAIVLRARLDEAPETA